MNKYCLLLLMGLLNLLGCASPAQPSAGQPLAADVLLNYAHCGATTRNPRAAWIADPHALERWSTSFNSAATGNDDLLGQMDFSTGSALRNALNSVDFSKDGVLVVSMGKQPTAGYGLEYENGSARLQGNTLEVTLAWVQPQPGYLVAQMVTSPCVLLKLPQAPFAKVRVFDQKARLRVETDR